MKPLYLLIVLVVNLSFGQKLPAKSDDKDFKPVEIKIEDTDKYSVPAPREDENEVIYFAVVEKIPMFANCKDIDVEQNNKCFELKMKEHIAKNLKNPNQEKTETNKKIRVLVQLIIKEDGLIDNILTKCLKNTNCEAYEKEAIRVVKLLPKFIPATHRGKNVAISYVIPITFSN